MIVSALESLFLRVLLGGALDAHERDALSVEARCHLDALLKWCALPGTTEAAAEEIAAGALVRRL